MRKICLILSGVFLYIGLADAAIRGENVVSLQQTRNEENSVNRSSIQKRTTVPRSTIITNQKNTNRSASKKTVINRSAQKRDVVSVDRNISNQKNVRAAVVSNVATKTFGSDYNSCRDAYFTCMDQFCALQNESYRRCICSSKLKEIQAQEKKLAQTEDSLKDFENLNINVISKTSGEVKAMLSASTGESAIKKDTSNNANALQSITDVLNNSKKQSLSTLGQLDIAGDIKNIWSTVDFIGGTNIANLTGDALFNAVHSQCTDLVKNSCQDTDLKMVSSAYGIYIENDCTILANNIKNKTTAANTAIRQTRQKMQDTRLENYNAHNSLTTNDCIAKVREDLTADTACGNNFIHCLDFSGKYLNVTTGEPIYSPDFYQIENQISLSGDILTNNKNTSFVSMLNKKRTFAEKSLDLCRDEANQVWDEFLRQAIIEIYQAQQNRAQTVKNECLQVVNECYLNKSESLKKFVTDSSQMNFVQTLELSEEMCADKLNTCSNLYGGGPEGLHTLIATMTGITELTIEQSCPALLAQFAHAICAVPANDTIHTYPYGCRKYAPGESYYARNAICNTTLTNPFSRTELLTTLTTSDNYTNYLGICGTYRKKYIRCNAGYYLYNDNSTDDDRYSLHAATECHICPIDKTCLGGTYRPENSNTQLYQSCGPYYIGSLYQQLVIYALQNCVRTSDTSNVLSEYLLSEVNKVAQSVKDNLVSILSTECINLNGIWIASPWLDEDNNGYHDLTGDELHDNFYINTGANKLWGYCKE